MMLVFPPPVLQGAAWKIRALRAEFQVPFVNATLQDLAFRGPVIPGAVRAATVTSYLVSINILTLPVCQFFIGSQADRTTMTIQTTRSKKPASIFFH